MKPRSLDQGPAETDTTEALLWELEHGMNRVHDPSDNDHHGWPLTSQMATAVRKGVERISEGMEGTDDPLVNASRDEALAQPTKPKHVAVPLRKNPSLSPAEIDRYEH